MSLVKQIKFQEIIKQQIAYKLKANYNLIGSLVLFQLVAVILSLFGQVSSLTYNDLTITVNVYAADVIIGFSLIWIFIMPFYIANRSAKDMAFTFITNKLSNHLANVVVMFLLALIGSLTSVLLGVLVRLGIVLYYGVDRLSFIEQITLSELLFAIFITFLYHLLLFSAAYVISEVIQLHQSFVFLIPLFIFGLFMMMMNLFNEEYMISFFINETNLSMFVLKVISAVAILWVIAIQIDRRLEVKRS